ncbi:MAG: RNA polymerase sigma factor [Polyangia bacterium]|jgi:RNA polymerase sigma factor (sigma-70 family)
MSVAAQVTRTSTAIEQTYRERRSGFLAWAIKRVPDPDTAEDVLQDAFLRAVAAGSAFTVVEDAAAWVFSTLRNRLIDLWREGFAHQRAGEVVLSQETLERVAADAGFHPEDRAARNELLAALEAAVAALPPEQREVVLTQAIEGITFAELAKKTGISIDTLMARKRRAMRKLAAALEYWFED